MKKIRFVLLNIFIFIIYYYFYDIINLVLSLFNLNYENFNSITLRIYIYLCEILPVIFIILMYKKDFKDDFIKFKKNTLPNAEKYISLWILAIVAMCISSTFITLITGSDISNNEEAIRSISDILPIYTILSCCILAPIGEELAFRKSIRNIFSNDKIAIIVSGLLFGLAHVIGTYESPIDLLYVIPYGSFGSVFMYMYIKSDNIFTTMSTHFLHNTVLTIMMFLR